MTEADERAEQAAPRFPYVAVDVDPGDEEEAGARLFELGASGVEQRDGTTLARGSSGKVTVIGTFSDDAAAREAAEALAAEWSPRVEETIGDAWRDEWKKHFEPFALAGEVVIAPPWRTYEARGGERVIVLEPGRAFGTGLHETTALVAEALVEGRRSFADRAVLDVGCGSGILSLVALVLGADRVRAVDIDPDAVLVARENASRNGLSDRLEVDQAALDELDERFPVIVANIEALVLVDLAPALTRRLAPGGSLVLSGILAPEVSPNQLSSVRAAFPALGREEVRRRGEWVALVLRDPG